MEKRYLKNQIYYCTKSVWKYTFICIILALVLIYVHVINYILVVVPFFISAFVSLIHEIGNVNDYRLKLAELEEN